ncbi:NUDIX hydrolase [Nitrogeniibacter aestuarii]|uniref:NUDIX hydrolase n=1 Tax=Nitrogeniibacter aestuarii TaxID=2815343 RepID=UPI001E5901B8|nr:NUDIX domain-containing protein [Nitrogeniibacter aestuarii]
MAPPGIPTGVHVIFERAGQVLLMRRCNTGFFDGLFSLPGGHIEPGESVRETAVREMREELGLNLSAHALELVGVVHRRSDTNRIDFFLRAMRWRGEPERAEPQKCDALLWAEVSDLPGNTVDYVCQALMESRPSPWVVEAGWSDAPDYLVY